jgi:hypothetical protein
VDNFSPELNSMLALMRCALGTTTAAEKSLPADSFDPARLCMVIDRHRLGAWLQHCLPTSIKAALPPEVNQHLQASAAATAQRALAQAVEQVQLVRGLESAGIEVIAVKGAPLAQRLHGGLGRRHAGDIDLLVRHADVGPADVILQATGLRRTRPDFPLTPRQTRQYLQLKPEFEYVRTASRQRIELLWRLEGLPETEEPWTYPQTQPLAGTTMRALPPEIEALYLFLHGARHGWFRLFWLVDIAVLLQSGGELSDWPALVARARRDRVERAVFQGGALAETLLGVPCPSSLRPPPTDQRRVTALVAEARRQIARDVAQGESTVEWFRQAHYRVRLQQGARAKFAMLAPHLFSPLNWQTWPLADRWFFLYYILSPFLWLSRRFRRQ